MIYPVKPIDLNLPSTSVTSPFYQSDYQIDGSATERGATGTAAIITQSTSGAFCNLFVDPESGITYLQGGTLRGSYAGTKVINNYPVIAAGDSAPLAQTGNLLYLKCNITALVVDGVMLSGVTLNSASLVVGTASTHTFTATAATGDLYHEIGRWTDDAFLVAGACNLSLVAGCPSFYSIT
jgi:hypothetical protein